MAVKSASIDALFCTVSFRRKGKNPLKSHTIKIPQKAKYCSNLVDNNDRFYRLDSVLKTSFNKLKQALFMYDKIPRIEPRMEISSKGIYEVFQKLSYYWIYTTLLQSYYSSKQIDR